MFDPGPGPRCFALPPGCDFSQELLAGLRHRLHGQPPEAMAAIEIYVNTQRTRRRLMDLFLQGPAGFLPRIRAITDLAHDPAIGETIPAAISPLRRRLELSQAVSALLDAEPDLAPRSAMFDLADSLANLMDEMHGEGVDTDTFGNISVENHSAHWARSLRFLNILAPYFRQSSEPDIETRQRMVVEYLSQKWRQTPPAHPIIVAGSTGSRRTTALFMRAVADLPQGAVVLPGFDFELPIAVAASLDEAEAAGDHPQACLVRFIRSLGLWPNDVRQWTATQPPNPARNRLVSLALRPAPITDTWLTEGPALANIEDATAKVTLIEAPSLRDEAVAIALRLRAAAEAGQKATLISPDRQLTRQVTAALSHWNITPDDSAGQPLPLTPPGVFLRIVANALGRKLDTETLLILLKHPLSNSAGPDRNRHLLRCRDLELEEIRGKSPFVDFRRYAAWAARREQDPDAVDWIAWLERLFDGIENADVKSLAEHVARHRRLAEHLAQGPQATDENPLWLKESGIEAERIFANLESNADAGGTMSTSDYAALFRSVLTSGNVRESLMVHPDITILGTLEARVQSADLVILGGLNDGVWPALPAPDPWLNRSMRRDAGLLLPERRIGLAAHDFQQAIAADEVVLSRSLRDADAPTVASRWLIRLINLLEGLKENGKQAHTAMLERGQGWLDMVATFETPDFAIPPAGRPSPRPPVPDRPRQLSVTQIKTLIRDPYAIYAKKVLRLYKLDPIRREPDAMLRGQALHKVLEVFVKDLPDPMPDDAAARLLAIAGQVFSRDVPWPATRRLWLARLGRVADWFINTERDRQARGAPLAYECKGALEMDEPDFKLTGTADRIDRLIDGSVVIYDYKTGAIPTNPQIRHFDKQMPLEAMMAEQGAFGDLGPLAVSGLEYIGLGSNPRIAAVDMDDQLVLQTWQELRLLIRAYEDRNLGYTARARMERRKDVSDYDHLSRHDEWQADDAPSPEDVP